MYLEETRPSSCTLNPKSQTLNWYKMYLLFENWEGLLLVNSLNVSSLSWLFDCEW